MATKDKWRAAAVLVSAVLALAQPAAQNLDHLRALDQQIDRIYQDNESALPRFGPAQRSDLERAVD